MVQPPQIQTLCTQIAPIPLPADDCDRSHTMHAALSSLSAATASFDAAMDAVQATTTRHRQRVKDLDARMSTFRQHLSRLDEIAASKVKNVELDDRVCMVYCQASYENALKGMKAELAKVHEEIDSNNKQPTLGSQSSSNSVRSAANAAVQKSLQRDVEMDDGQAIPSDAWLDHAHGFGVGKALQVTNDQRSVPLLLGEEKNKGEMDYEHALDTLVQNAAAASENSSSLDRLGSFGESQAPGKGAGDDESVYSVTSQMSGMSMASSTRMTAGQRRRWHMQQQKKAKSKASSSQMLSTHPETSQQSSAVSGRQQAIVGSQPYLCEVLHDSYGIGIEHAKGLVETNGFSARGNREGGAEFYPVTSHINDLLVFNTTRNSYGIAQVPSAAGVTKTGNTAPPVPNKSEPTEDGKAPRPISPTSTLARKAQLAGSATKSSLAHLVFKADANAETKQAPTLDLPASLPQGV